ncbi:MAG TPA: hypothetical protein DCS64_01560, partial [Algoriphagus sp.]
MLKAKLIFSFLLFFWAINSYAQTDSLSFQFGKKEGNHPINYILTGKITDKKSGEGIDGVGVHVDGFYSGISTDRFGTYF